MYQINKSTGDIKQAGRLSKGYIEVGQEEYEKLQGLDLDKRLFVFQGDDVECDNARIKNTLTVGNGDNAFTSNGNENAATGAYVGVNPLTADETFRLNALTGDATFAGTVATKDFDASGTATARSQKGNKSKIATLEDVASSTAKIKSPKDTIAVGADADTITLDVKLASKTKAGIAFFPVGSGIKINEETGEVTLDGAIAPFKYIDIWDAATNTPKLSDATGKPETFYITHIPGSQNLGSGLIKFEIGDWVLCQEDIGGAPKYAKVPMSEVLTAITASMIKAGTLGKGIAMDTDQPIKTTAGMESGSLVTKTITVVDIIVTGSIVGQK